MSSTVTLELSKAASDVNTPLDGSTAHRFKYIIFITFKKFLLIKMLLSISQTTAACCILDGRAPLASWALFLEAIKSKKFKSGDMNPCQPNAGHQLLGMLRQIGLILRLKHAISVDGDLIDGLSCNSQRQRHTS